MSANSIVDTQSNGKKDDNHVIQINTNDTELANETKTIITENNENQKSASEEVVVNIDNSSKNNLKRGKNDKDFTVYVYPSNQYVYAMQVQGPPPGDGAALDYTPDRNSFLKLVFTILFIMILVTAGINTLVFINDDIETICKTYSKPLALGASGVLLALSYVVSCTSLARQVPCNFIILIIDVLAMSVVCCVITVRYDTEVTIFAVIATAGVVLICFALACTSFDFTSWLLYIVTIAGAFAIVSMAVGLASLLFGYYMPMLHLVILCIGLPIYMIMLTMELQLVLGGKTVELQEDDYVLGAYMLYQLIVSIFLQLVQIIGIISDD